MGKVVAAIKVMPDDADADLDALEGGLRDAMPEIAEMSDVDREEVAFGLTALIVNVGIPDEEGGTGDVEEAFRGVDRVESVTVENVGRV